MMSPAAVVEKIIRPMGEDDLEQVQAIDQISFSLPWPKRAFRYELFENPRSMSWVAASNQFDGTDMIVGMIVVWMILDEAHIATLAVLPEYRRQGYAQQLVFKALTSAIEKGARQATLEVRARNSAAQDLYTGFGFEIISRRPRYYQDNREDAIIMTLVDLDQKMERFVESDPEELSWRRTRVEKQN